MHQLYERAFYPVDSRLHDISEDDSHEDESCPSPVVPTRSPPRRERSYGLGIKGFGPRSSSTSTIQYRNGSIASISTSSRKSSSASADNNSSSSSSIRNKPSYPAPKRLSTRNSLVSLLTKSAESSSHKSTSDSRPSSRSSPRSSSRASSQSPNSPRSPQSRTPESTPHTSLVLPASWRSSVVSAVTFVPETLEPAGEEKVEAESDLTTYHANLARFKAERAERTAELGVEAFDDAWCRLPELSPSQTVSSVASSPRDSGRGSMESSSDGESWRNSTIGVGRGLKIYWGGGALERRRSSSIDSGIGIDDRFEKEAFKDWWDRLGSEPVGATA